jgi:hypothetical protein
VGVDFANEVFWGAVMDRIGYDEAGRKEGRKD